MTTTMDLQAFDVSLV